ncbi:hypothetical protein LZK75_17365 [Rhizobium leguminosarum]|nr:hypothetical protein LZK75_17365 [Rhizobium leguminosarum]
MSAPLRLTGTTLRGDSQVRVSYTYETHKGRRCQGRADVETVYLYGRTDFADQGPGRLLSKVDGIVPGDR